jgi:hypothetical protein
MTQSLNVLIVHGIGWRRQGGTYCAPLQENIRAAFAKHLHELHLKDVKLPTPDEALRFQAVCWDPVTQDPQDALLELLFGKTGRRGHFSLTYQLRRNMVGLLGDVAAYESNPENPVYRAIHAHMDTAVRQLAQDSLAERVGDDYSPLTIIAHSLGSVISSDYVWDHTKDTGHSQYIADYGLVLINMILLGSPMAVYALRGNAYGSIQSIHQGLDCPVRVDPKHGLWLNVYDEQDAIALPLEPIHAYKDAGVVDYPVNAGNIVTSWNLASHTAYWTCKPAAHVTGHKLALDWARLNSAQYAELEYEAALTKFRKTLKKKS